MVFDKNYDRALWLMLQGYKSNKELILDFINKLTNEMYEAIYNLIDQYNSSSKKELYSEVIGDDFRFLVQIKDRALTLVLNTFDSKTSNGLGDRYELSLLPIVNNYLVTKTDINVKIGSFSYKKVEKNNKNTGNFMRVLEDALYELSLTNGVVSFVKTRDSHSRRILALNKVNINKIPNDISIHYFTKKRGKCRIRRK